MVRGGERVGGEDSEERKARTFRSFCKVSKKIAFWKAPVTPARMSISSFVTGSRPVCFFTANAAMSHIACCCLLMSDAQR